jgi:hypothetical protein
MLETCGSYLNKRHLKKKLDLFVLFFQVSGLPSVVAANLTFCSTTSILEMSLIRTLALPLKMLLLLLVPI